MKIKSLHIVNFRGIDDLKIKHFSSNTLIIGKNDVGKTNLCYAIRKLLDIGIRRIPFNEADSSDSNKKPITLEAVLSAKNLSTENRSLIGQCMDKDSISISLKCIYNEEMSEYEETFFLGKNPDLHRVGM